MCEKEESEKPFGYKVRYNEPQQTFNKEEEKACPAQTFYPGFKGASALLTHRAT